MLLGDDTLLRLHVMDDIMFPAASGMPLRW